MEDQVGGITRMMVDYGLAFVILAFLLVVGSWFAIWFFRFLFHPTKGVVRELIDAHKGFLIDIRAVGDKLVTGQSEHTVILSKQTEIMTKQSSSIENLAKLHNEDDSKFSTVKTEKLVNDLTEEVIELKRQTQRLQCIKS
jgi:hypothetical protein